MNDSNRCEVPVPFGNFTVSIARQFMWRTLYADYPSLDIYKELLMANQRAELDAADSTKDQREQSP